MHPQEYFDYLDKYASAMYTTLYFLRGKRPAEDNVDMYILRIMSKGE